MPDPCCPVNRKRMTWRPFPCGPALHGCGVLLLLALESSILAVAGGEPAAVSSAPARLPEAVIGYTELRTDLPGGRHPNVSTSRAFVVNLDGTGRRELAPELASAPDTWTQFAGWSPDGSTALIGHGWEDPENARWEEEHGTFRMEPGKWRHDSWLLDWASGRRTNVTAVDRVSHYNSASFAPGGKLLLMTSLVEGTSKPYVMDPDGNNKRDVSGGTGGFTYGFHASPDGKRICYHENYQVYLANADGTEKRHIDTGHPFNFAPVWSPDGGWLLFVSGEHYDCHPHVVRADGSGLRMIAQRAGYRGVTEFLDVPDFHGGSSDTPAWSADGQSIFYTAKAGDQIELFQVSLDGTGEQLTHSGSGTSHYHPKPSPDGNWLLYGSKRSGVRQIFARDLGSGAERQITRLPPGHAAMWPHWRPHPPTHRTPVERWASPSELRRKKLIGTGQYALQHDAFGVTPRFLEAHPEFSRNHAFDGTVVLAPLDRGWSAGQELEKERTWCLDELSWGNREVPYEAVAATVATLQRVQWGAMTDNFLWFRMIDGTDHRFAADFTRDADWAAVEANAALAARVCREARLKGFMLDTEQYGRHTPSEGEETGAPFPMGRDTPEVLQRRGHQWIRAVQREFPEVVIVIFFAWSPDLGAAEFLKGISPFLDGVLEGIEPPGRLVHGYENTFYYGHSPGGRFAREGFPGGRGRYQWARDAIRQWRTLSANPARYDQFVETGMAAWLESDPWNLWPGWPQGSTESIWSNLPLALAYSDEYVWCWSEHTHYGHTMGEGQLNPFLASITNQTFNTGREPVSGFEETFASDPLGSGWYFDFDMLHCAARSAPGQALAVPTTNTLPYAWSAEDQAVRLRPAAPAGSQRRRYVRPVKPLTTSASFHGELDFRIDAFPTAASAPILLGFFNSSEPLRRQALALHLAGPETAGLLLTASPPVALPLSKPLETGKSLRLVIQHESPSRKLDISLADTLTGTQLARLTHLLPGDAALAVDEMGAALAESACDSDGSWQLLRAAISRDPDRPR